MEEQSARNDLRSMNRSNMRFQQMMFPTIAIGDDMSDHNYAAADNNYARKLINSIVSRLWDKKIGFVSHAFPWSRLLMLLYICYFCKSSIGAPKADEMAVR